MVDKIRLSESPGTEQSFFFTEKSLQRKIEFSAFPVPGRSAGC